MALPTIVFVPGAFFPVSSYQPLLKMLGDAGFPIVAGDYPSHDPRQDPAQASCAADAEHVRRHAIAPLVETEHKDVVVLMHSYGGVPGAAAASGLGKRTRKLLGKEGGVLGLIMVSALVGSEGVTCGEAMAEAMGGKMAPWVIAETPRKGFCMPHDPVQVFAADVDEETAAWATKALDPQASRVYITPQPHPAYADPDMKGLNAFVVLTRDVALPPDAQEAGIKRSGQEWIIEKLDASHNGPFLKQTAEMTAIVKKLVSTFRQILE